MSKICKKGVHGNDEKNLPWGFKKCPRSLDFTLLTPCNPQFYVKAILLIGSAIQQTGFNKKQKKDRKYESQLGCVSKEFNQLSILRFHLIEFMKGKFRHNVLSQKSEIIHVYLAKPTKAVIQLSFSIVLFKSFFVIMTSSVIMQEGESQNGCFKKTKHARFSENFPKYVCVSFRKFDVLCFLETPVLRFAIWPYYRQLLNLSDITFWT